MVNRTKINELDILLQKILTVSWKRQGFKCNARKLCCKSFWWWNSALSGFLYWFPLQTGCNIACEDRPLNNNHVKIVHSGSVADCPWLQWHRSTFSLFVWLIGLAKLALIRKTELVWFIFFLTYHWKCYLHISVSSFGQDCRSYSIGILQAV